MIEYGDSVYVPEKYLRDRANDRRSVTGPLGRWVKRSDPDYDQAYAEQSKIEASWVDAREETGDG